MKVGCIRLRRSLFIRGIYSLKFLACAIFAYIMTSSNFLLKFFYFTDDCKETQCQIYVTVFRVSMGLVLYHSLMMLMVIKVNNSSHPRAVIQNGMWPAKLALWAIPLIGCFLIEPSYFYPYWIPSLIGSIFFIFIQGFIFVDSAWAIAENLMERYRARQTKWYIKWRILMWTGTCLCYLLIAAGSVYLYYEYAIGDNLFGCGLNIFFITFNFVLCVVINIFSILPVVREKNPNSGLFQAAILATYITYLMASAVVNSPYKCSSEVVSTNSSNDAFTKVILISGAILTLVAIMYAATSSGSNSNVDWGSQEVSLDDEKESVVYNYAFFHFAFVLAAFNIASVMTNWQSFDLYKSSNTATSSSNVFADNGGSTLSLSSVNPIAIDSGFAAIWVKIGTSWISALLFIWTLAAPVLMPDRTFTVPGKQFNSLHRPLRAVIGTIKEKSPSEEDIEKVEIKK